jgi:hypothetical protein
MEMNDDSCFPKRSFRSHGAIDRSRPLDGLAGPIISEVQITHPIIALQLLALTQIFDLCRDRN